jgi:hypothetical protein
MEYKKTTLYRCCEHGLPLPIERAKRTAVDGCDENAPWMGPHRFSISRCGADISLLAAGYHEIGADGFPIKFSAGPVPTCSMSRWSCRWGRLRHSISAAQVADGNPLDSRRTCLSRSSIGLSRTELHEVYAKRHLIDDRAPIQSSNNIDVRAEVGKVWEVISDVTAWSTFNLLIGKARLGLDSAGELIIRGTRIHIKFAVVDRKYELAWTGKLWTKAVERPVSGDTTRLHLRESLAGALVTLFFDSARLPRHHLTSLATNGREARQNKLATRRWPT